MDKAIIDQIKHIETFYEQAPPGFIKEKEELPEECIPDTQQNQAARDFLANAPTKGLWMPLGKEVKVMQCWRCKNYGHRTGDRECPMFQSGNETIEKFRAIPHCNAYNRFIMLARSSGIRNLGVQSKVFGKLILIKILQDQSHEDPMFDILNSEKKQEQKTKVLWLQSLIDEDSTDGESSDSSSGDAKRKKKKKKRKKGSDVWVEKNGDDTKEVSSHQPRKKKSKKHSKEKEGKKKDKRDTDRSKDTKKADRKRKMKDDDDGRSRSPDRQQSRHSSKHKHSKR